MFLVFNYDRNMLLPGSQVRYEQYINKFTRELSANVGVKGGFSRIIELQV